MKGKPEVKDEGEEIGEGRRKSVISTSISAKLIRLRISVCEAYFSSVTCNLLLCSGSHTPRLELASGVF